MTSGPSAAAALTLPEITARLLAAPPLPAVPPPAPEQTLASYALAWGGGRNVSELLVAVGASPYLADRVDARLESAPEGVLRRLAALMGRPYDELVWAAGNSVMTAFPPGLGGPSIRPTRVPPPTPIPPPAPEFRLVADTGAVLVTESGDTLAVAP